MTQYIITVCIILILPILLSSHEYAPSPGVDQNIKFEHLSVEHGLSNDLITLIHQDKYGFMWFGTPNGLNRFDGYDFTIYKNDHNDPYSIAHSHVNGCIEDRTGNLWVHTWGGGLARYNLINDGFINYQHDPDNPTSLCSNYIEDIYEDRDGNFWISTIEGLSHMIFSQDGEGVTFVNYFNDANNLFSLKTNHILQVVNGPEGYMWVFTYEGLNIFDTNTKKFYHSLNWEKSWADPISEYFKVIYPKSSDDFYNVDSLILRSRITNNSYEFYPKSGKIINHYQTLADSLGVPYKDTKLKFAFHSSSGEIWIATANNGIYLASKKDKKLRHLTHNPQDPYSLGHNAINIIFEDNSGIIWIGHYGGGISRYNPRQNIFSYHQIALESAFCTVTSIHDSNEDPGNDHSSLWIGTRYQGLLELDRKTGLIRQFKHPIRHIVNEIYLEPGNKKHLWIGTFGIEPVGGGFYRFNKDNKKFRRFYFNNSTLDEEEFNRIRTIIKDSEGMFWITTDAGLFRFDPGTENFTRYLHDPSDSKSLSDNHLTSIQESFNGGKRVLWIGSLYGGVNQYDPEKEIFTHYKNHPNDSLSINSNWVKSIYESKTGRLWVSTELGLNLFDPLNNIFIRYLFEDHRLNDKIYGMYEDTKGNLWFNTEMVLVRLNPTTSKIRIFDTKYDLPLNMFNPNAYHRTRSGEIYLGGPNGFISFYPDSIKESSYIPPVVFTDFKMFNKSVIPGLNSPLEKSILESSKIVLKNNQTVFSFEFAALDFTIPEKNQYAYKMDGIDPNWVFTDASRRFATYTHLDPGEYVFRVKGSNSDGIWNEQGTSVNIIILPPWWKTWWAYSIYVALILGVIYGLRRYELSRKRYKHQMELEHLEAEKFQEQDRMKSRFFANISHEFRTPLTLIKGPIECWLPKMEQQEMRQDFEMTQRNMQRLLRMVNQLLDISRLESGKMKLQACPENIVELTRELTMAFESLACVRDIELRFISTKKEIPVYLDREQYEKIITNLLFNALKFTPSGGEVIVDIPPLSSPNGEIDGRMLEIRVKDTGIGIPAEKLPHIFDRFYQATDTYVKDSQGSGIGLALTKELLELHHGKIEVSSDVGKGTEFIIKLPLGNKHLKPEEIVDVPPSKKNKDVSIQILPEEIMENNRELSINEVSTSPEDDTIVLIVEDNQDMRSYISNLLVQSYSIVEAVDGKDGFKKAAEIIPDIIISDVMMPEMDGFQFCRKIKTDECTSHIPVILLTAKSTGESKMEGLETGADDYLIKPFDSNELKIRIKNLIEQRRKLQERFRQEITLEPQQIAIKSADAKFLQKVTIEIEKHMETEFGVMELSNEVGMSRSQLFRKLKALINQTPLEFIRTVKIKHAARLLEQHAGNISEIAYQVGFSNPAYFAECFRKVFGTSPKQYASQFKQ
jgi:signal transduction histidine kinase/DNA-binding response OmpR family regulator/ligand-binding sensor domain-containing protein